MVALSCILLLVISSYEVSSQLLDCGLTGCVPGQILNTASEKRIYDALASVVGTGRQSKKNALGIGNVAGTKLALPRWYTHSGMIHTAAPVELATRKSLLLLFTKTNYGLYGTEGVFTYDFEGTDYKLAVMWSVPPKDDVLNVYNIKVYPKSTPVGKDLYNHMKSVAGSWEAPAVNATAPDMQERVEYGIKLRVHMTGDKKAIQTVTVDSSGFDSALGSNRVATCENKTFSGQRCRIECVGVGQCWTGFTCSDESTCQSDDITCSC